MRYALIAFALLAAACAGPTLTADQCAADWEVVGLKDGSSGAAPDKIRAYNAACPGGLTDAEIAAWVDGWEAGVDGYCAARPETEAEAARQADVCQPVEFVSGPAPHGHYHGPRIRPRIGLGVVAGSRGVKAGVGVGYSIGPVGIGLGFGF